MEHLSLLQKLKVTPPDNDFEGKFKEELLASEGESASMQDFDVEDSLEDHKDPDYKPEVIKFALKHDEDEIDDSTKLSKKGKETSKPCEYACEVKGCNERYSHHKHLISHAKKSHGIVIPRRINSKTHGNRELFPCPADGCDLRFPYHRTLEKHALKYHNITVPQHQKVVHKCPFCDMVFRSRSQAKTKIITHLESFHINEKDNPVYIQFAAEHQTLEICQECGEVFKYKTAFYAHMKISHPETISLPERCEICGKAFKSKESLASHMQCHEQCESLCVECGKTYYNKRALKDHIREIHSNKEFICSVCSRSFPTKTKLTKHVRVIHLDERNYPCELCAKRFKSKDRLQIHVRAVHDKVKPFLCEQCTFECARIDNLHLHRRKSHGATTRLSKNMILEMVEHGKHPYYDKEKLQLLLAVNTSK